MHDELKGCLFAIAYAILALVFLAVLIGGGKILEWLTEWSP